MFDFTLHATDGAARTGTFTTPHGNVETPAFMPVGTNGSVKGVSPEEIEACAGRAARMAKARQAVKGRVIHGRGRRVRRVPSVIFRASSRICPSFACPYWLHVPRAAVPGAAVPCAATMSPDD